MKTKHYIAALAITAMPMAGCTDYQDELDALEYRVSVLEKMKDRLNSELEALTVIADAAYSADYITNVTNTGEGYIITFADRGAILIRHGSDGEDGVNGSNGQDAQAPSIGLVLGNDGNYYWTLNGEIIYVDGQPIRANGHDGVDGRDGRDGVDGRDGQDGRDGRSVTPEVRINESTGQWEITVNGGTTWIATGVGATGRDGRDGRDGVDGQDGKDANSFFEKVEITTADNGDEFVVFTLKNGTSFRIPLSSNH